MPVLLFSFGSYSFGSVLLNLIMVPLAGILLPILYFSLLIQKTKLILLTEPIWSITEFLIQILIYLSENLSKPIGFYKEMKDTAWIGIAGWILLCIKIFYYSYFIEKYYLKDTEQSTENNVLNLYERFIESKTPNSQTLKREKPSLQNSILTKIKETTWENQNNLLNSMNKIFKNKINKPKNIDHKIQNLEYSTLYKPKTFRKIWYPIFCILFFLTTLGIHVLLYKSPDWFPQKTKSSTINSFLYSETEIL
ncbi:competence domain protein [Leptospira interrogans serovar Bataviae str. HAI135]|nr:competence domain protein [Leptospira interrogans serovar Bataviae str. HAI135]